MNSVRLGTTTVEECERCQGIWLDVGSFEKICADREQQAAVLGGASATPAYLVNERVVIKYLPCPHCSQLMNRLNFARCSGVIVDVCKGHGTWFDRDELSRIIEFIRAGGLEVSRGREKAEIEEQRRMLRQEQLASGNVHRVIGGDLRDTDDLKLVGIASAGALLEFLLE